MHLELEVLMKKVFANKLMEGLRRLLGINREMYVIPREETQKNLTANHIKNYLSKLFEKEYSNFMAFKEEYEKIKKDMEAEPSGD